MALIRLSEPELAELANKLHAAVPALDEREQRLADSLYRLLAAARVPHEVGRFARLSGWIWLG